ncbi:MAG: family 16 glycoside hydrolase [Thermoguttaceae bacterium]|jgi:alpha-L-arabinofuranosidase
MPKVNRTTRQAFVGLIAALLLAPPAAIVSVAGEQAAEVRIEVHADHVVGRIPRHLTGACIEDVNHEIYGGLYSQMIFGESFQEPAPAPSIKGFKPYGGRWIVRDGVLSINGLDGPKLVSERGAFKNGTVGVELLFAERKGENAGVIVRVNKPANGADAFSGYEVSLDAARQRLRLGRHRDNFELIKDVPCEVAVGRWIPLEVKLAGPLIEILVDGKSTLRHDDGADALPTGGVGLRVWHCETSYRNLRVPSGEQTESLPFATTADSPEVSGMWRAVRRGHATGRFAIVSGQPFAGAQSQRLSFDSGDGQWGVENQGLNRWGMNFVAGKTYEGYVWARGEKPAKLFVALESRDGSQVHAETPLVVAGNDWRRLGFTLTPNAADKAGRFAVKLKQPGSVVLGHAFLQPGEWGRFRGLPVRRDVAEALIAQGITVLRYGGSMVNHGGYKWKNMIGPRDRRPPYSGTWYRYSSNGWGIPDFMEFCEAAGVEYVPDFNINETPQDMADFIEYAKGPAGSRWGRKRVADGHPAPYRVKYVELGNEERVDEQYAAKFAALAEALWAKDPEIIPVVGDFAYDRRIEDPLNLSSAASRIASLAGQRRILQLAKRCDREVWFDVHVDTDHPVRFNSSVNGMFSFCDALDKIADGAKHKVVVFEYNAGNHAVKRALANAATTLAIERDGRLPIATSANGLQPDGQNDNGWDQGLLFLNPSQVWLQPPGYVTQMFSRNYQPQLVECQATGVGNTLDANAKRSDDRKTLVLQVVNPADQAVATHIYLAGFVPTRPAAQVTELSGPLEAVNAAGKPDAVTPRQSLWKHGIKDGQMKYPFPPHSFTVMRFD